MEKAEAKRIGGRRALLAAVLGAAALLLLAIWWMRGGPGEEEAAERPRVPVEVAVVRPLTLEETVRGIGTLRAAASVEISSEVAGRVRAIQFEEGAWVEEGAVLFELDDERARSELAARRAALRAAEVRMQNARRTFERQEQLLERGVVTEDDHDRARMDFDTASADLARVEAELALAERQLSDLVIRAPFAGAISARQVDRGAFVSAGQALAGLFQLHPLEVDFSVPERFLGRIRRGQRVAVTLAAYPDETFEGTVDYVSPSIEEATRTLAIKAVIPNLEGRLTPGAFATAVVTVGERRDRPVAPEESLVGTRTGFILFVVEDGVARSREVRTGLRREGLVEITEGVQVGEQVVRSGHLRLEEGSRVEILGGSPPVARDPARLAREQPGDWGAAP